MELVQAMYSFCEDGRPPVLLTRVVENEEVVDRIFVAELFPYFYLRKTDLKAAKEVIERRVGFYKTEDDGAISIFEGVPMVKVQVSNPKDVAKIRNDLHGVGIPAYESDIPYVRRWMIDSDIRYTDQQDCLYFDIEVDASHGFPNPALALAKVVSIAAVDNRSGVFFYYAQTQDEEIKLLHDFHRLCKKYTVICGWNSQSFDREYLMNRSDKLGVELDWKHLNHLDIMLCIKKVRRTGERSYTLQYFAEKYLGESKSFHEHNWYDNRQKMMEILSNYDMLREYNIHDSELVQEIDKEFEMAMIYCELARLQYVFPMDTRFRGVGTDAFLLRLSMQSEPRVIWPNRGHVKKGYPALACEVPILADGEENPALEGGLVLPADAGRHEWVMLFDYSNMYPSIIATFNIGIQTKTSTRTPYGFLLFDHTKQSLFATAVRELIDRRTQYKRLEKQYSKDSLEYQHYRTIERALKVAMLANWGVIGDDDSRFYDYDVASSITAVGRYLVRLVAEIAEDFGIHVVYGDTDSVFLLWGEREDYNAQTLLELGKKFEKHANKVIRERMLREFNLKEETFEIELELGTIFRTMRFPAHGQKKRYMGLKVWEDDFKYEKEFIGFEAVRSDSPILLQEIQETIYRMDLEENRPTEEIREYLTKTCREVFAGSVDEKLVKSKGLSKPVEEYTTNLPHVRAAKMHPNIQPGDKVHFVVLSNKGGPQKVAPVIGSTIPKIGENGYIYIWDDLVAPMLERTFGKEFVVGSDGALCESLEKWLG